MPQAYYSLIRPLDFGGGVAGNTTDHTFVSHKAPVRDILFVVGSCSRWIFGSTTDRNFMHHQKPVRWHVRFLQCLGIGF